MKNKRYAVLVAAVALIGFVTLDSFHRSSQLVTVVQEYTLIPWRRGD